MVIYKATNLINGKVYIGQTIYALQNRINRHNSKSRHNPRFYFHRSIKKYGENNFKWEILRHCDNIESLNAFEQYYILYYDSMNKECGYNLTNGGLNCRPSESTKKKMSMAQKGKIFSDDHRKNISIAMLNMTDEHRKKLSIAMTGKHPTAASKKKNSDSHKGEKGYWYGKHFSKETRQKLSKSHTGKKLTEEHKKNIGIASKLNWTEERRRRKSESLKGNKYNLGKKHTESTKKKISMASSGKNNGFYGKKHSKETKQKMKDAWDVRRDRMKEETNVL